jgi:hypothetical protein
VAFKKILSGLMSTLLSKDEATPESLLLEAGPRDTRWLQKVRSGEANSVGEAREAEAIANMRDGRSEVPRVVTSLKKSLAAEKSAREALARAEEERNAALAIQREWERLASEFERLHSSVELASDRIAELTASADRCEEIVSDSIGNPHTGHNVPDIACQVASARAAIPFMEKGKQRCAEQLTAHISEMRKFGAKHGIPSDVLKGLSND